MNMPKVRDSNGNFTKWLYPLSCSIHDSLQPLSTASMVLPPEDEINNLDWVEVPVPDGSVMYCRVSSLSTDAVTGQKSVYLEHGACLFDDIIIPENSGVTSLSWKTTISAILTNIINKQPQNQVFRWTAGTIQATDTIYIEPGGMSLMTAVMTMMESIPGYQVEFVQASATDWHIDIKQRPTTVSCEGRLSRNLRSCNVDYSTSGIVTRVYCEGINTAGYMESSNKSTYGLHEETMSVNDGLTQAQRQSIVQAYLDAHDHPAVSISISALELSQLTGVTFDRFKKGTLCRIVIPWLGLTVNEVIVDKSYGDVYGSPEEVTISLANTAPDLSIAIASITGGGGGGGGGAKIKQNERFATKFEQTKEYFRLLATDSEWDAMGNSKINVYSQITQTASSIQSVVSRTGYTGSAFFDSAASYVEGDIVMYQGKMYRFNAAHQGEWTGSDVTQVTNLYSTITQNEAAITSEVSRATAAEGTLSSRITQAADSVSMIIDSSTGAVSSASLILAINGTGGSSATISADKINLQGYVTASQLDTQSARIDNLINGTTVATTLAAASMQTSAFYYNTGNGYQQFGAKTVQMQKNSSYIQGIYLGLSSQNTLDLTHAHKVTVSSSGVLTLGTACDVGDSAANFNIADTQFYQDAVSAARTTGWDAARGKLVPPAQGTSASMDVGIPGSTYNTSSSYGFTVSTDSSYAYIKNGLGQVVARCTNSGGGSSTVDSIALNGNAGDGTTATEVKVSVPVAAYDANGNELKNAIVYPIVPATIYTPTLASTSWYRSDSSGTSSASGRYATLGVKAETAGGLGLDTANYTRYIGGWLDDARDDGIASVTLTHQSWSDQSSPTGTYTYTLNPGHNRKFQVNASNGQSMSCVMTAPGLSASDWTRTNFSRDTSTYNNGHALSIPVSVKVGGITFSNTDTATHMSVSGSALLKSAGITLIRMNKEAQPWRKSSTPSST